MKRTIYTQLCEWKNSSRRKPLIVRGARQVGKTYILKHFGANEYANIAYFNFEDESSLDDLFKDKFDKDRIISYLSVAGKVDIEPEKTLIIFDEIQAGPRALNALKYFNEDANEFHVAAAGSLLGVKLAKSSSFPVGKVNFCDLYPMSFLEYLEALGKKKHADMITHQEHFEQFPEFFHTELIDLLKQYYFVGGMPEAVSAYVEKKDFNEVRTIQKEILDAYTLDFSKHAPRSDIVKISGIWRSLPAQLAKENKRFIYSAIEKNARAREYGDALEWLVDAGMVYKVQSISKPGLPLSAYANAGIFKVYMLDVGLLNALANVSLEVLVQGNEIFTHFHGALAENYVAQQLVSCAKSELYYWTSSGTAEVDFVFEAKNRVYPLEVKAGVNVKSKSLSVYKEKYKPVMASRTSLLNLTQDSRAFNYPLYAISKFPMDLQGSQGAKDGN